MEELLGDGVANPAGFDHASMVILRLAPQDYHRYHSPVGGTIASQHTIGGSLHSVNSDAMTSGNYAIFNTRVVTIINTPARGRVAFVAIGAVCVGSVQMVRGPGDVVGRGDELGYFQFGGSTIAVLFEDPASTGLRFDDEILALSALRVETLVRVRQAVARFG